MQTSEYNYDIGSHFASAIINGDISGLEYYGTKNDIERLNAFLDEVSSPKAVYQIEDCDTYFDRCDITGEMSDCLKLTITYFK